MPHIFHELLVSNLQDMSDYGTEKYEDTTKNIIQCNEKKIPKLRKLKNVDIKFSAHDAFLEKPSSDT